LVSNNGRSFEEGKIINTIRQTDHNERRGKGEIWGKQKASLVANHKGGISRFTFERKKEGHMGKVVRDAKNKKKRGKGEDEKGKIRTIRVS